MKRLLLILLILLAACADIPEGEYVAYQGTPPSNFTPIATIEYEGYHAIYGEFPAQETATPQDTSTPLPTSTIIPTNTPRPTNTPSNTPEIEKCVVVTTANLRVRTTPAGAYLATLETGYILTVDAQYTVVNNDNPDFNGTWYRFFDGWVHSNFVTPDPSADCSNLPVWGAPTSTPQPTDTPTAYPTVGVATPTPESQITPYPTSEPTQCAMRSQEYNLRIRVGPGTIYDPMVVNGVDQFFRKGETAQFKTFAVDQTFTYLWGERVDGGWIAVADSYLNSDFSYNAAFEWYVAGVPETELCLDVNTWPEYYGPIPIPEAFAHNTALMWHAVTNANGGEMLVSYKALNDGGITGGVKPYVDTGRCIEAITSAYNDPPLDAICIYRWPVLGTDCPDMNKSPSSEGERWMREYDNAIRGALFQYADSGRLWIEVVNECDYGDGNSTEGYIKLEWWKDFMNSALDYVERAGGWPPLVMPTLGPGHGSLAMFEMWKEPLVRLSGMGGLFGDHSYTPWHDNGLCAFDEWLAARSVTNHEWMAQAGYGIDISITEAARDWGNSDVDPEDFACWYREISQYPYIHSVSLWTAGYHPTWPRANLNGWMTTIAEMVAQ